MGTWTRTRILKSTQKKPPRMHFRIRRTRVTHASSAAQRPPSVIGVEIARDLLPLPILRVILRPSARNVLKCIIEPPSFYMIEHAR